MAEKKLSDAQFLSLLRDNAGMFAQTARAIEEKFNIKYSRQSVRARAETFKEILDDINEENLDIAEGGLMSLIKTGGESAKIKAIEIFLKNKGRNRGYVDKSEVAVSVKELPDLPTIIIKTREKDV